MTITPVNGISITSSGYPVFVAKTVLNLPTTVALIDRLTVNRSYAETLGIHKVSEMDGAGRRMPLTTLAFSIGTLGMMGAPLTAGARRPGCCSCRRYLLPPPCWLPAFWRMRTGARWPGRN